MDRKLTWLKIGARWQINGFKGFNKPHLVINPKKDN